MPGYLNIPSEVEIIQNGHEILLCELGVHGATFTLRQGQSLLGSANRLHVVNNFESLSENHFRAVVLHRAKTKY